MITYGSTTLTSYNSIVRTEVYYYKSTSATSLSGGSWSTTKPTWENGKYIWQKIRTVYEDGTHTESDPVNITGQQGATGTAAYSYKLNSSDSIIGKTKDGEYTIKKITFSATYKQGTGAVSAYGGRFKIESTTNGSTWKTEYTSSGNESSKEFTIPDDIIAIKCSLYQSDGATVLLDIVTVPVVKDGVDAIGLRDSIPYYLASDKDTGITRLTQGWTRYRPQLTAEKKYLWVYYVSRYSEGSTEPELIEIKDDLVHFVNNGDESPVESCVVDINPVQDLHGYDSPYPAGGGEQLIPYPYSQTGTTTINGITFNVIADGDIAISGTASANAQIDLCTNNYNTMLKLPAGDYTISVNNTNVRAVAVIYDGDGHVTAEYGTPVSRTFNIPDDGSNYRCRVLLRVLNSTAISGTAHIAIKLQKGSSATSWSPYSNICPISGWTSVDVEQSGVNLFDFTEFARQYPNNCVYDQSTGEFSISTLGALYYTGVAFDFNLNDGGYVSAEVKCETAINVRIRVWYSDGTFAETSGASDTSTFVRVYTTLRKKRITSIRLNWTTAGTFTLRNFYLTSVATATDYEPYQGTSLTIPLGQTVYGGKLDVTNGVLTVDRAMITKNTADMNNTSADFPGWRNSGIKDIIGRGINDKMNHLIMNIGTVCVADTTLVDGGIMALPKSSYGKTQDEWKALAIDVQAVLPLATPITYQLTPQEITMLCKENNIFADTGQTAISYYDNQTSTDPYVDYSVTSAFEYADTAMDKIDNLKIGGKNLLRGTKTQDTSLGNYKQNVTAIDETLFGCTVFTSSVRWADIGFDFKKQILDRGLVKAGDSVTYSIWAKTDDTEPRNILGVWVGNYYSGTTIAVLSSEWTQYSKTFVITEEMLEATSAVMTRFECNTDCTEGKYIYWAAPKLERGTKATDWMPAPEDVDVSIATAQSTADTAMDRATAIYGTCSTDSTINAKAVTCSNFVLFNGARIQVTFTNANTASAPTLNVNSTGAKAIYINKTVTSSSNLLLWTAGSKMEFVYDGTGWVAQNVPYALYGTCSTGASTAAKAVTCNEAVICKGTTISVNMTNTNTAANATLNVGSTVAKDIYANDAKLTVNSRFNWRANTVQKFVFDGQVWRMDDDSVKALATAYITEIDEDGIMVHPEDDSTSGWAISDAIQLFKNGISYIKLWIENNIPKIRIGKEDQGHIILDNDSVDVRNGDDILASFGETSIIGDQNQWHQTIASDKTSFANGQTEYAYISPDKFYAVNAEVSDAFYIGNYSIRNAKDGKLIIGLRRR